MDSEKECEQIQRWKAAMHFSLNEFCRNYGEEKELTLEPSLAAALTEVTFRYLQSLSRDLELFAKHGKRSQVSVDDVLLTCRKSTQLHQLIRAKADSMLAIKEKENAKKRKKEVLQKVEQETEAAVSTAAETLH